MSARVVTVQGYVTESKLAQALQQMLPEAGGNGAAGRQGMGIYPGRIRALQAGTGGSWDAFPRVPRVLAPEGDIGVWPQALNLTLVRSFKAPC